MSSPPVMRPCNVAREDLSARTPGTAHEHLHMAGYADCLAAIARQQPHRALHCVSCIGIGMARCSLPHAHRPLPSIRGSRKITPLLVATSRALMEARLLLGRRRAEGSLKLLERDLRVLVGIDADKVLEHLEERDHAAEGFRVLLAEEGLDLAVGL